MVIVFRPSYESYDEYLCSGSQLCRLSTFCKYLEIVNMKTINVLESLEGVFKLYER